MVLENIEMRCITWYIEVLRVYIYPSSVAKRGSPDAAWTSWRRITISFYHGRLNIMNLDECNTTYLARIPPLAEKNGEFVHYVPSNCQRCKASLGKRRRWENSCIVWCAFPLDEVYSCFPLLRGAMSGIYLNYESVNMPKRSRFRELLRYVVMQRRRPAAF